MGLALNFAWSGPAADSSVSGCDGPFHLAADFASLASDTAVTGCIWLTHGPNTGGMTGTRMTMFPLPTITATPCSTAEIPVRELRSVSRASVRLFDQERADSQSAVECRKKEKCWELS